MRKRLGQILNQGTYSSPFIVSSKLTYIINNFTSDISFQILHTLHPPQSILSLNILLCSYYSSSLQKYDNLTKMLQLFGMDDNKKIGLVLLAVSAFLYFFGIILFFVRSLLLLSNLFFFCGLYFFIGFAGLFRFFVKKGKIKGSIIYFGGFVLIIINFGFFGAIAQIFGIFLIFRTFLPDLYDYICKIPFVGKYLKSYWIQNALQRLAGSQARI